MLSDPGAEWEQAKWKGWHVSLSLPRRIHVLACFCSLTTLHNRWMSIDWTAADGDGHGVQSNPCFVKGGDVQNTLLQLIWRNSQYTMVCCITFLKNRRIWEFLTFLSRRREGAGTKANDRSRLFTKDQSPSLWFLPFPLSWRYVESDATFIWYVMECKGTLASINMCVSF